MKLSVETAEYERKMKSSKKVFEDFTKSIGINVKNLTAVGIASNLASGAINKFVGDIKMAISQSVEMAKQAQGIEMAFNRLNRPDLLNQLREATHGTINDMQLMQQAVKFDNFNLSLEQMGTMLAFAQQQAKDTGQDIGYLVDSIVTGLGRQSLPILDNLGLSATDIKERMKETGDMTTAVAQIIQERMDAAGGYFETAADRAAQSTTEVENAMIRLGKTLTPLEEDATTFWNTFITYALDGANKIMKVVIPVLDYVKSRIKYLFNIGDVELPDVHHDYSTSLNGQPYSVDPSILANAKKAQQQARNAIRSAGGTTPKKVGRGGGTTIEKTETQLNNEKIDALAKSYEKASAERRESIRKEIAALQKRNEEIQKYYDIATGKVRTPTGDGKVSQLVTGPTSFATSPLTIGTLNTSRSMSELETMISGLRTMQAGSRTNAEYEGFEKSIKPLQKRLDQITGEDKKKKNEDMTLSEGVGMMVSGVSNMASGLEQLGIKVPEGMQNVIGKLQAITTILTAIQTMQEVGTLLGFWHTGGVARAAGGLNVVPGNWGHDMVPALLQSGEVVLNRAQQGNLSAQLANNNAGMQLTATLRGEDIQLSINNRSRRRGRGEYVTTKFR